MAFPSDLEIARGATLTPLADVGAAMGLGPHLLEPYGEHVVKVKTVAIGELAQAPRAKYVPTGWVLPVREARASVGAGFIYPFCGDMRTVPGLSASPAATRIDIDSRGEIVGLS